ncbi:MAG: hypothetical protein ACJ8C4_11550 [Gemmataceae bacterium]
MMHRHRLATEADYYRLPEPPPASISPESFMLCAIVIPQSEACCLQGLSDLYRLALDQARAAARDSHPNRTLYSSWN